MKNRAFHLADEKVSLPKEEKEENRAIYREIVSSEKSALASIQKFIDFYDALSIEDKMKIPPDIHKMFGELKAIIRSGNAFLDSFESNNPTATPIANAFASKVFDEHFKNLTMASLHYKEILYFFADHPDFEKRYQQEKMEKSFGDIPAFYNMISQPFQRAMRYDTLFGNIMGDKNIPEEEKNRLRNAADIARQKGIDLDKSKGEHESQCHKENTPQLSALIAAVSELAANTRQKDRREELEELATRLQEAKTPREAKNMINVFLGKEDTAVNTPTLAGQIRRNLHIVSESTQTSTHRALSKINNRHSSSENKDNALRWMTDARLSEARSMLAEARKAGNIDGEKQWKEDAENMRQACWEFMKEIAPARRATEADKSDKRNNLIDALKSHDTSFSLSSRQRLESVNSSSLSERNSINSSRNDNTATPSSPTHSSNKDDSANDENFSRRLHR